MSKRKRRGTSPFFSLLMLSAALFLILAALAGAYIAADFFMTGGSPAFTVYLRRGERRIRSLGADEAILRGGEPLVSVSVLSEYCGYGVAGDCSERTIVFPDGTYASFSGGTAFSLNGENAFLAEECVATDETVFVPLSFYETFINGLSVTRTPTAVKLVVDLDVQSERYALRCGGNASDTRLPIEDYFNVAVPAGELTFKTDLSAYEQYMNPADRDAYLLLVNYDHTLDRDYLPPRLTDLVDTRKDGRATQQMDFYAAMALEAMLKEAAANGCENLSVTSGYRSYNYQQQLFDNQVSALTPRYGDAAREKAAEAVAIPGTSEHQSGLCADLHNLPAASQTFADTDEYTWLINNCAKFGFILRYPKEKTNVTKIMFEPWHYRFVGRYHAQIIMQQGLCLEEYLALLSE